MYKMLYKTETTGAVRADKDAGENEKAIRALLVEPENNNAGDSTKIWGCS
jgi:hypothetical protein